MTRLSLTIKTTAILFIWAGAASAHIGDVARAVDALKPQAVLIAQPLFTPAPDQVAAGICALPLENHAGSPTPMVLACLSE